MFDVEKTSFQWKSLINCNKNVSLSKKNSKTEIIIQDVKYLRRQLKTIGIIFLKLLEILETLKTKRVSISYKDQPLSIQIQIYLDFQ